MSDATLPDCLVVYLGPGRGLHYSLGSRVGAPLVHREVGATLSLYAADHIEAQAEKIRVLREALETAENALRLVDAAMPFPVAKLAIQKASAALEKTK